MIDAEEALRIGLINRITTQENLIPECEAILRKIIAKLRWPLHLQKMPSIRA